MASAALLPAVPDNALGQVLITPAVLPSSSSVWILSVFQEPIMGICELRALAKDRGIQGYRKMSKTVLLSLLAV